jgi:hypothetical protein
MFFLPYAARVTSRNQAAMGVNAEAINMMTKNQIITLVIET